jgi:hypothetical protein
MATTNKLLGLDALDALLDGNNTTLYSSVSSLRDSFI